MVYRKHHGDAVRASGTMPPLRFNGIHNRLAADANQPGEFDRSIGRVAVQELYSEGLEQLQQYVPFLVTNPRGGPYTTIVPRSLMKHFTHNPSDLPTSGTLMLPLLVQPKSIYSKQDSVRKYTIKASMDNDARGISIAERTSLYDISHPDKVISENDNLFLSNPQLTLCTLTLLEGVTPDLATSYANEAAEFLSKILAGTSYELQRWQFMNSA